ncbi:MAG: hypothetical protein NC548_30380 [Lachnospiraceae bacterium]|nr:hypothetical protein [Lachnospiraceae bacterium]
MNTTIESLDKANVLLDTIMEDYGVFDSQNPTGIERDKYRTDCGKIHALISLVSDCVASANKELREGCANE